MKDSTAQTIELGSEQLRFLEEMARKYSLTDAGKAVRCLVNYARDTPDQLDAIFNDVRCLDC
jgi:hypothetical protein